MSNHIRKTGSLGVILCLMLTLFSGCVGSAGRAKQKKWVEKMNKTFKKDEFTYSGPQSGEFGQEPSVAVAKSKKFPKNTIIVKELNGELLTNYNFIRYHDDAEDYVYEYFDGEFECDSYEVKYYANNEFGPIIDYSFDEYMDELFSFNRVSIALISEDGDFPSDEELAGKLLAIAKDRDEICDISLYCIKDEEDDWVLDSVKYFKLYMKEERKVQHIQITRHNGKKIEHDTLMENVTW